MKKRVRTLTLINLNAYWLGLSYLWNSLHVLVLPAVLLRFVDDARKNTALGLLTFGGLVIAMVVQPLAGAWSDRLRTRFGRRRPWIAFGTAFDLFFLAVMAAAGGLPMLALAYIGLQISSNLAHGPAQGLMHDQVPSRQMGVASGVKNLFDMAGLVLSSLLVGRLLTPDTLNLTLGSVAAFLLIGAGMTLFGVREKDEGPAVAENHEGILTGFGGLDFKGQRDFWRLIIVRLAFLIGVYGVQSFAQYYIRDTLNVSNPVRLTGDLLATIVLTLIGFSLVAGYLSDRLGRKPLHFAAAALLAIGSLLMMAARSSSSILLFGSIIGAGIGLFLSANWALANDLAPQGEGGKFLGLTNIATAGAGALGRLFGPGIDWINAARPGAFLGYNALFACASGLALISALLMLGVPEGVQRAPLAPSPDITGKER